MTEIDPQRLWFLRGVLAALASSGEVVPHDEIRRLCNLDVAQAAAALKAARAGQYEDEPDFRVIVVNDAGWSGEASGPPEAWPAMLRDAQGYWRDRRNMEDDAFRREWGHTPTFPWRPRER